MYSYIEQVKNCLRVAMLGACLVITFTSCTARKVDSEIKRAEELVGTRKFDEAIRVYRLVSSRYPNHKKTAIAYLKMGDLYFYTFNNGDEALKAYLKVKDKWPFTEYAREAALKGAEVFHDSGNSRRAIGEYEWVLDHFPEYDRRFQVRLKVAEEYLNLEDPFQASVELEELLKNERLDGGVRAKALFELGESYLFLNDYEKALNTFKTFAKDCSDDPQLLDVEIRIVECLEKLDRFIEAISLQEELAERYPDSETVQRKVKNLVKREEKLEKPD